MYMYISGMTIAEYFRDERGQDVLLFVDNIFRFTQVKEIANQHINTYHKPILFFIFFLNLYFDPIFL